MKVRIVIFLFTFCFTLPAILTSAEFVTVQRGGLLHTGMLFSRQNDGAVEDLFLQIRTIATEHKAELGDVAKLNLYTSSSDPDYLASIRKKINQTWPDPAKRPAITLLPTKLPVDSVVAADVVIALSDTEKSTLPRIGISGSILPPGCDAVYISGRAASGELAEATAGTMKQLFDVLTHLDSGKENVVQVKAFITPMSGWETVRDEIRESFGDHEVPPLVFVEWNSSSRATEIELIATAPASTDPEGPISYFTPPGDKSSPVYSRVARISGDKIVYIGGVTGPDGSSPEREIQSLYSELERIAKSAGSDLRHFAKATYYVSENGVSKALNELRPKYYDPERPPAASKVQVPDIGVAERGMLIDMVAVPVK